MFDVHATEEEDKLVLLSAIDRLGGCTEEQLMRFAVETGLMSQFPFSIALSSLKEAAFVRTSHRLEGELLHLTPEGRQSVELFASRIRASRQEKLDLHCAAWRRRAGGAPRAADRCGRRCRLLPVRLPGKQTVLRQPWQPLSGRGL